MVDLRNLFKSKLAMSKLYQKAEVFVNMKFKNKDNKEEIYEYR